MDSSTRKDMENSFQNSVFCAGLGDEMQNAGGENATCQMIARWDWMQPRL